MRRFVQLLVAVGLPVLVLLQDVSTPSDNDISLSTTSANELSTTSADELSTSSADETLSTSTTDIDILSTPADKETPECGLNEQFLNCSSCEGTCAAPSPACTADCQEAKCQCLRGFVRHTNGSCVHESSCSQWPVAPKPSTLPPVPTCPLNEIYLGCSTCEGTCAIQTPTCPLGCQPAKCQCIAGFVRHLNGSCVRASSCTAADLSKDGAPLPLTTAAPERPPTCSFNEIYLACASCDGTCADPTPICPLGCQPGRCQCLAGFVRNAKGACVPRTECTGDNFTSTPSSRANRLERQVPLIGEDDRDLDIRPH